MAANALLSLFWTPILLRALGTENYGSYTAFLSVLGIAVAGEFGLGAATGLQTNRLIAAGDMEGLRRLHSYSRRVFAVISLVGGMCMLLLSPWLPQLLHFDPSAARGSLHLLFALGAVNVTLSIVGSYLDNSAYAAGTVVWPIVPAFVLTQFGFAIQIWLATLSQPLWIVHLGGLAVIVAQFGLSILFYRHSHSIYSESSRYRIDLAAAKELVVSGLWAYPFGLTMLLNAAADRLVVNGLLGAREVPRFQLNNRLCELVLSLAVAAGAASMPKIVGRLLSNDESAQLQGRRDASHLGRFQALLGFAGALGYLLINDQFIAVLFGKSFRVGLSLQAAFAVSLVIAVNSEVFVQLCGRIEQRGLRVAGVTVLSAAVLNLALSLAAAGWFNWMAGVAWSTCVAQLCVFAVIAEYVRRRDGLARRSAILRSNVVGPLAGVAFAVLLKWAIGGSTLGANVSLGVTYVVVAIAYCLVLGPGFREIKRELSVIAAQLGRK